MKKLAIGLALVSILGTAGASYAQQDCAPNNQRSVLTVITWRGNPTHFTTEEHFVYNSAAACEQEVANWEAFAKSLVPKDHARVNVKAWCVEDSKY
jgi:hypothetical protein